MGTRVGSMMMMMMMMMMIMMTPHRCLGAGAGRLEGVALLHVGVDPEAVAALAVLAHVLLRLVQHLGRADADHCPHTHTTVSDTST
jgi:ABC-type proline/glycine betaine transport system permease subunit